MIVGLTGKSCSGKNFVGEILKSRGLLVWDTDAMCHDGLYLNIDAIISVFGPDVVIEEEGKKVVSRARIGKVVFSDPAKRKALEDILYPWLEEQVLQWRRENPDGVLVLNGALLYRSGIHRLCSCVIYVDATHEVRLSRALKRDGITEEAFERREDAQRDVDFRVVDYGIPVHVVVNNEFNVDKLNRQVFNICDNIGILKGNCY